MSETKDLLRRGGEGFAPREGIMDSLIRRRDRKRRNQRITAGVVGIAVFVAAVWIVTSGLSFDRTQTPAVPGLAETGPTESNCVIIRCTQTGPVMETGPTETGPAETGSPHAPAQAAPDVVEQAVCSDRAGARLELTDIGDQIKVRFEVHRSPVGHSWRIVLRHGVADLGGPNLGEVILQGTRVADENGDLSAQRSVRDLEGGFFGDGFRARATDKQTGQICWAIGAIGE
jgi:hypothetical protein